jgi:hypothetical protein
MGLGPVVAGIVVVVYRDGVVVPEVFGAAGRWWLGRVAAEGS